MTKYYKFNDSLLKEHNSFVYEVEIFKSTFDSFNLEEVKYYKSQSFIEKIVENSVHIYQNYRLHKTIELVAAPLDWLKANTSIVEIESSKEKKARIKQEKLEIKNASENKTM